MNKISLWLIISVLIFAKSLFTVTTYAENISTISADGFVYPVIKDEPPDPYEPVFNRADPLNDGWAGNGVGANADSKLKGHLGQDYFLSNGNSAGKRVYAAENGIVVEVMNSDKRFGWCDEKSHGWGRVIVIKHEATHGTYFNTDGSIVSETYNHNDTRHPGSTEKNPTAVYTLYGHLSKRDLNVKPGDTVKKGQSIARIGSSVEVSEFPIPWTPHLHFEIKSQKGFDEGVWKSDGSGKRSHQRCEDEIEIEGIGSGYSYISNYAPERYNPSSFIQNSTVIGLEAEQQAIVFLRDGNLWVMDNDGNNQRQLTDIRVGNFSVSKNGHIVFDRFNPLSDLTDLNIYLTSVTNREIKKLTYENKSIIPVISPNGKMIAFQKFRWLGEQSWRGSGEGIWIMDLNNEAPQEYLLADVLPIPDEIKKERTISFRLREGQMDEGNWLRDENIIWSPDNKLLIFLRRFEYGGLVNYIVYFQDQKPPRIFPEKFLPFILDLYNNRILYFDNPSFSLRLYDFNEKQDYLLSKKVFVSKGKFSPDGKDIIYETRSGQDTELSDLWIVDSKGENIRKVFSYDTLPNLDTENVSWSIDGKKILFERYLSSNSNGENEIWVIEVDGLNLKKLADNATSPHMIFIPELAQKQTTVQVISKKDGDIKEIDFGNFSYEISDQLCSKTLGTSIARTQDGTFGDPTKLYFGVYVDGIVYGDLTGDGKDEAVVLTYCGGMHPLEQAYIYILCMKDAQSFSPNWHQEIEPSAV